MSPMMVMIFVGVVTAGGLVGRPTRDREPRILFPAGALRCNHFGRAVYTLVPLFPDYAVLQN